MIIHVDYASFLILWAGYFSLLLSFQLVYLQQTYILQSTAYSPPHTSISSQATTKLCRYMVIWIPKKILNKTGDPTYTVTLLRAWPVTVLIL